MCCTVQWTATSVWKNVIISPPASVGRVCTKNACTKSNSTIKKNVPYVEVSTPTQVLKTLKTLKIL